MLIYVYLESLFHQQLLTNVVKTKPDRVVGPG